jgi:stalled ribosome rescue protein Dom34
MHSHAVVWLDSREAHVYRFNAGDVDQQRLRAHSPFRKVHHKAGVVGAGHLHLERDYFDNIVDALRGVEEWLLVGPGPAKNQFLAHLDAHIPWLKAKMLAVEPMDHPTDGELLDHARRFFHGADRLRPNSPVPPGKAASG